MGQDDSFFVPAAVPPGMVLACGFARMSNSAVAVMAFFKKITKKWLSAIDSSVGRVERIDSSWKLNE